MRYIIVLASLLLSGCVVLDVSTLDTAKPLEPNHVQIQYSQSIGLDLSTAVITDDEQSNGWEAGDDSAGMWPVSSLNLAFGLPDSSDLGIRFWASSGSSGGKLQYKRVIHQEDKEYIALIPALTIVKGSNDNWDDDERYSSIGGELQLLYTYNASKYFRFTAGARGNYNRYTEKVYDDYGSMIVEGPYNLLHWGVRGNIMAKYGALYLIPEIGAEMIPVVNGNLEVLPVFGLGIGLEF